jgi:hypothetical protein
MMQHLTAGGAVLLANVLLQKKFRTLYLLSFLLICMLCSLPLPAASAATVTVAWDKNPETNVIGYELHYGTISQDYQHTVDVENNTSRSISGLIEGQTYYFAVKAYNDEYVFSDFSEELVHTIPNSSPPADYLLTVDTVAGGSVILNPDGGVYEQTTQVMLTASAESGWEFSGWDGDITGSQNPVSVTMNADMHVTPIFTELEQVVTYTITSSSGPNGSITPVGTTSITQGANQSYSISPDSNYHIRDVQVDGVSVGAKSSYTFLNVTTSHTITAFFDINTYMITASSTTNGSILPFGSVPVVHGDSQTFTIAAAPGYSIAEVVVDDSSMGAVTSYSFTNIVANHTISASFDLENQAPIADAGPDQSVESGVVVSLRGSNSIDLDDGIASFLWEQVSGPPVELVVETIEPDAAFVAPAVESNGESLTFELTVTDYGGLQSTDTCIVNVSWVNIPPVSDSGAEQTVDEGTTVTLDGSKSSDADDGIALHLWKQVSGIPVTLSDTTAIQSSFTAPKGITKKESLEFNLTVEDGGGLQSSDSCVVSVTPVIQQQPPELTVSSISVRRDKKGRNYKAIANVTITSDSGNVMEGVYVIGDWSVNGEYLNTSSGSTNTEGEATLVSNPVKVKSGDIFSISISDINKEGFLFNPINNFGSRTVP